MNEWMNENEIKWMDVQTYIVSVHLFIFSETAQNNEKTKNGMSKESLAKETSTCSLDCIKICMKTFMIILDKSYEQFYKIK